jgi:cobalamin biosynthesis Mg chelatase CobN
MVKISSKSLEDEDPNSNTADTRKPKTPARKATSLKRSNTEIKTAVPKVTLRRCRSLVSEFTVVKERDEEQAKKTPVRGKAKETQGSMNKKTPSSRTATPRSKRNGTLEVEDALSSDFEPTTPKRTGQPSLKGKETAMPKQKTKSKGKGATPSSKAASATSSSRKSGRQKYVFLFPCCFCMFDCCVCVCSFCVVYFFMYFFFFLAVKERVFMQV